MKNSRSFRRAIGTIAMLACATAHAQLLDPDAQAFSFQARLVGPGIPQNGTVYITVSIYDDPVAPSVVSGPHTLMNQSIANSVVSVTIPGINVGAFDGSKLWVGVRVNMDPELTPRVPLIAVPYALRVHRVGNTELDDDLILGDGVTSGSLQIYDDQGATAIALFGQPGTGNPSIDVAGTVQMTAFKLTTSPGQGFVLTSDANGLGTWQPPGGGGGFWSANGDDIYNNNAGNVGIGTGTPQYRLHVTAEEVATIYSVNTAGEGIGVYALSEGGRGTGVFGWATATSGGSSGVRGMTNSSHGHGLLALAVSTSGTNYGVYAQTASSSGYAGYFLGGRNYFQGNVGIGIGAENPQYPLDVKSTAGRAMSGHVTAPSGDTYGVVGESDSDTGRGVLGLAAHQSGTNYGVYGMTLSPSGYAGYFQGGRNYFEGNVGIGETSPGFPLNFASTVGDKISLWGNAGDHYGFGIQGGLLQIHTAESIHSIVFGYGASGNFTETMRIKGNGRVGIGTGNPSQKLDVRDGNISVTDGTTSAVTLHAQNWAGQGGLITVHNDSGQDRVYIVGDDTNSGAGGIVVLGANGGWNAHIGHDSSSPNHGLLAVQDENGTNHAGFFVDVNGDGVVFADHANAGVKSFKIDHPLDPGNKYLYHSCVESPDMMNVYNGNVVTDANGEAWVELPAYFQALNKDFRYQLTVIGQFAQAIVAAKIEDNRFSIRTDKPKVEVSWQVTGVRQDAFAQARRIRVEVDKGEDERGRYLHPELFGQPKELSIGFIERGVPPEMAEQPEEQE